MNHSPFVKQKQIFRREPPWYEKAWDAFKSAVNEWFIDHMPSEDVKQMPPAFFYPIGSLLFVILIIIYFSIFIPNYNATIDTEFLAPTDFDGADHCHSSPISTTGDFLATFDGEWQGSTSFQYSKASYLLSLSNAQYTEAEYKSTMDHYYANLQELGQRAMNMDLSENLLLWMIYSTAGEHRESTRLYLTGNPLNVFNRQKTYGCISNVNYDCRTSSDAFFDEANGIMEVNYNYLSYQGNENCSAIVDPAVFGHVSYANPTNFEISVDVRALITSISVNLNLISINDIEMVAGTRRKILYNGINYVVAHFFDPQFPNMKPMTCFYQNPLSDDYLSDDETIAGYRCVIIVDGVLALPVFNHVGNSTTTPTPCNCSTFSAEEKSDPNHICNRFLFITGLLFYNGSDYISPLVELLGKYEYNELNRLAYYPMYLASMWGNTSPLSDNLFQNAAYRRELYDFCNTSYGLCTLVTFSSFDLKNPTWEVSSYYYQVQTGACQNTFAPPPEIWNKLIETPYAPLVQGYQVCKNDPSVIFFQEAGIAIGNVSIMTPFAVVLVLLITYCYQCCTGKYIPKSYSSSEKADALDSLAVALLLARDKKLLNEFKRTSRGAVKVSIPSHYPSEELINSISKSLLVDDIVKELEVIAEVSEKQYVTESTGMINWQALWNKFILPAKASNASADEYGHEMSNIESSEPVVTNTSSRTLSKGNDTKFNLNPMHASSFVKSKSQLLVLNFQQFHGAHVDLSNEFIAWKDDQEMRSKLQHEIHRIQTSTASSLAAQDPLIDALAYLDPLIESFESLVASARESSEEITDSTSYWSLVPKTAALRQWRVSIPKERLFTVVRTFIEGKELAVEIKQDLITLVSLLPLLQNCRRLLTLHGASYLKSSIEDIQSKHAKKLAYMVVSDVWTLKEFSSLLDFIEATTDQIQTTTS